MGAEGHKGGYGSIDCRRSEDYGRGKHRQSARGRGTGSVGLLPGSEQGGAGGGASGGESKLLSALVTELLRDHFLVQVRSWVLGHNVRPHANIGTVMALQRQSFVEFFFITIEGAVRKWVALVSGYDIFNNEV